MQYSCYLLQLQPPRSSKKLLCIHPFIFASIYLFYYYSWLYLMTFPMQMRTITRNALHCNHCCLFNYNILNSIGIHKALSYEALSRDVLLCKLKFDIMIPFMYLFYNTIIASSYNLSLFLLSILLCYLFLCFRLFLLRLFNFNNINPANPQRITAMTFCCMNRAIPPNTAKTIPKIPIACLCFINTIGKASNATYII
jgi:hypothetical protein